MSASEKGSPITDRSGGRFATDHSNGRLGPELVVRGKLTGKGRLAIEGRFEGDLEFNGEVAVGSEGVIVASPRVHRLIVEGKVEGHVVAKDSVVVRSTGVISGDVRAPRVAIDDGGELRGGIEMDFDIPASELA